jgi:ArsR family transcriptional regulator
MLEQLDPADPVLAGDAERLRRVLDDRAVRGAGGEPVAETTMAAELMPLVAAELGERGHGSLLYFGRAPDEALGGLARRARRVVGMNPSRQTVQRARATLHSAGLNHCVLQQGDLAALPHASASFDVVVIDRVLVDSERPESGLGEAARVLRDGGRLLVVEDFESLAERSADSNPLALLRAWLANAGLACDRLRPIDVSGAHLLLAAATTDTGVAAA